MSGDFFTKSRLLKGLEDGLYLPDPPDWAIPGSPTPFELQLTGLCDRIKALNAEIDATKAHCAELEEPLSR